MQTLTKYNIAQYAIGKQIDIAIGNGANASSGSNFFSVKEFNATFDPKIIAISEAQGNRSTNTYAIAGDREHPYSFSGSCDVNKIGLFLYLVTGSEAVVQDASTGAYEHTFTPLNNVVLPQFTIFTAIGAEGYRRITGCMISKLTINVKDSEASFMVEGLATGEDGTLNSTASVSSLVVSSILYQSGSVALEGSVMRYSFASSPNLATVTAGDVLQVPTAATGITNAVNKGNFLVLAVNNTSKYVDVINNTIFDNTKDEASITSSAVTIANIIAPSYPTPTSILLRRHSAVYIAANTGALGAATADGLKDFEITINNNAQYVWEKAKSPDPLLVLAHNIQFETKFTQIMDYNHAQQAINSRTLSANNQAFRFELEDTSVLLGTSTTYHPRIQADLAQALAVGTRTGMGKNDELAYDWNLTVSTEQANIIRLRNTQSAYAF